MGVPPQIKQLHKQFQDEFKKNSPQCESICGKLKLELSKLRNPLLTANGPSEDELLIARDVFELASFVSIRRRDFDGFERHVKQLKTYYREYKLKQSPTEQKVMGLYLLHLLSSDRIGEFHTELELVSDINAPAIQNPIQLERYLMEGNYAKINLSLKTLSKEEYYGLFLERLMTTMRRRIVDSLEKSSHVVDVGFASKMLYLKDAKELQEFIANLQSEASEDVAMRDEGGQYSKWEIRGNQLYFRETADALDVNAYETIGNVIGYATEIERIV